MPRENQNIRVNYWQKARNKKLSPEEKLVELFLITCPECGASGIFRMGTSAIAYEIGYTIGKIEGILKSLENKLRILRFEGDWIFVRGKFEYEPSKNENVLKSVEKEIRIAPEALYDYFLSLYNTLFPSLLYNLSDRVSDRNRVSVSVSTSASASVREDEKNQKNNGKPPKPEMVLHGDRVLLSVNEYQKLCDEFTKAIIDNKIQDMNDWIISKGKPDFKDFNRALRNWLRKDADKLPKLKRDISDPSTYEKSGIVDLTKLR